MNIAKIHEPILTDLRDRGLTDADIKSLNAEQLFGEYCRHHGLGQWPGRLALTLDNLREADNDNGN